MRDKSTRISMSFSQAEAYALERTLNNEAQASGDAVELERVRARIAGQMARREAAQFERDLHGVPVAELGVSQ